MKRLNALEKQFVLGDIRVFREFDVSGFVTNARNSLANQLDIFGMDTNITYYQNMMEKAISILQDTFLDKLQLSNIGTIMDSMSSTLQTSSFNSEGLVDIDVSEIRPQYLTQFAKNLGITVDRVLKGSITKNEITHYISDDVLLKVKKQMVKTTLPYYADAKMLVQHSQGNVIPITPDYVKNVVYPFVLSFGKRKNEMMAQYNLVVSALDEVGTEMSAYATALNTMKANNRFSDSKIKFLNYVYYNATRSLLSAVSYITYMTIHKINTLTTNILNCKKIVDAIRVTEALPPTLEGVLDTVKSMDSDTLAEDLMAGRTDLYDEISSNILNMNINDILMDVNLNMDEPNEDINRSIHNNIDEYNFNTVVYDDILKVYAEIINSLHILEENSEDYLLVVDDMISKAGLDISLEHRFERRIEAIKDVSIYSSLKNTERPGVTPTEMHLRILHELKAYPENMQKIAKMISDTVSASEKMRDRYRENINGEFENEASVIELRKFMGEFIGELGVLTTTVASNFMKRLIDLGKLLNEYNAKTPIVDESSEYDDVYDELIESATELTNSLFEMLVEQYQILKVEKDIGVKIVIEDGDSSQTQTTSTPSQPQSSTPTTQQSSQTSSTQTSTPQTTNNQPQNNSQSGNGKAKVQSALKKLNGWFDKMVEQIQRLLDGEKAKKDKAYFEQNKEALLSKHYANVSNKKPIIEYEHHMASQTILNDLNNVASRVSTSALTPQKLQSLNNDNDYAKVILPPALSTASTSDNAPKTITEYYLHGANTVNPVILKNNQLKAMVEEAVNYCEPFYGKYLPSLRDKITTIKNNMNNVLSGMTTESVNIIYGKLFTEDVTPAPTTNTGNTNEPAKNTVTSMTNKCEAIQKWVRIYCNAVLTAATTRYSAYMGLLHEILPDNTDSNNNQQPNTQEQQPAQNQ